jgi:hypothetical protein
MSMMMIVAVVEAEQQAYTRTRKLYVTDKTVREIPQICRTRSVWIAIT